MNVDGGAGGAPQLDLSFDDCNCGEVGFVCPPGTMCVDGLCVPYDTALIP